MNDTLPTEPNSAVPAAEKTGEYDLEAFADEYTDAKKTPEPVPAKPDTATQDLIQTFKPIAQYAEANMRAEAEKRDQETVQQAISTVKEEGVAHVPDNIVEAYLNLQYSKNPDFKSAYEKRGESPDSWTAALVKARESLSSDISSISKPNSDKDDTEAALAAVKGTSQTEIDDELEVKPKELFKMNDFEFAEYKRNLGS